MRPGEALTMRLGKWSVLPLLFAVLGTPAGAQAQQTAAPVSTVLATGHLASVVDMPLYVRLYRVYLPAGRHSAYRGASAMLYDLSGAPAMAINGAAAQPLAEGAGAFIEPGQIV